MQAIDEAGFRAVRATSPEKRLMLAVLEDAVDVYRRYGHIPGGKRRRLFEETEHWLFSDDTSWPLSFVNVCHVLGIEVVRLRKELSHVSPNARMMHPGEPLPLAS
jgi:hypothetical protein